MNETGLKIKCDNCGEVLTEQGALLFSPPKENGETIKHHLCKSCWRGEKEKINKVRNEAIELAANKAESCGYDHEYDDEPCCGDMIAQAIRQLKREV